MNAGRKFGMGHLSRNLTLAEAFTENNLSCSFLIESDDKDKVLSFLNSKEKSPISISFLEEGLNTDEDIKEILNQYDYSKSFLILDHYNHDLNYQKKLKKTGVRWGQFDFKRKSQIIADMVINPNLGIKDSDYDGLIKSETLLCVGEKYAIINRAFKETVSHPEPDKVLIAMGGGDYPQEVVTMIAQLLTNTNYYFDILTTCNSLIKKIRGLKNIQIHINPNNVADICARNHVAIVAGGVTTYELDYLNIPMIVVPYTDNQQQNAETWQEFNHAIKYSSPNKFVKDLQNRSFQKILSELYFLSEKRTKLIDGRGTDRIVKTIEEL